MGGAPVNFAIDIEALQARAQKHLANVANPAKRLTQEQQISQLAALAVSRVTQTPLSEACHSPCWTEDEMRRFADRRDRLLRWGYDIQAAEVLAERLTLRDREEDDRRACAECRFGASSRCPDGLPMPAEILHRCTGFQGHVK
jgi:hypothetical protein